MIKVRRHSEIVKQLYRDGISSVTEIAKEFGVTESTVRRDLAELANQGIIKRAHGGAMLIETDLDQPSFPVRRIINKGKKDLICSTTAQFIQDGETIFLDGGTTLEGLISHICNRRELTVVTCGFNLASELIDYPNIKTILLGGIVDPVSQSIVPLNDQLDQMCNFRVNKSFITAGGISAAAGVTNSLLDRIPMKRLALEIASESILVVDGTKVGAVTIGQVCPVSEISILITDYSAEQSQLETIASRDISVLVTEADSSYHHFEPGMPTAS